MRQQNQELYLAIDQGGHASRALVFDRLGDCLAQAEVEVATHIPAEDRVEHSPDEMVASIRQAVEQVLRQLGDRAANVVAAGLATQRSSMVCWHRQTGDPLSPVISWQDRRAHKFVASLAGQETLIHQKSGLFVNAHYGASKMRWCMQNLSAVRQAAEQNELVMAPLASYLLFSLLEERPLLVDPANAQRTQLMNLDRLGWDQPLLDLFEIPREVLPSLVDCRHSFGHLKLVNRRIPLWVCTGDQSAALFAEGRPRKDCWYANLGTGGFVQRLCDDASFAPRHLHSVVFSDGAQRWQVLEGTVNGGARALEWLAQQYPDCDWLARLEEWLESYPQPGLFINAVSGVGSPFWCSHLTPRFIDAKQPEQQFVAVVESIVFLLYHNMLGMTGESMLNRVLLSGGLARSDGLCQRLADLSGLPVQRLQQSEATARGLACLLAGLPVQWQQSGSDLFQPKENGHLQQSYQRFIQQLSSLI